MTTGQRNPEIQWTPDERKVANLDQRLKSLIMLVLPDDQMNYVINCLTTKSTWDDLILYHEGPSDVKESGVMDQKLCYNTFKFKEDFQDNPDGEEDTRSSQVYLNDLEEEYQARALLAKSKRFFIKGNQRFSSAKAIDQTKCHKCGRKGHFARDYFSKTSVLSYQSLFQPKLLNSSKHKPELRPTKYFEAKYNKVKAKLALLSSGGSAPKSSMVKNKGLIVKAYKWDEEEVSPADDSKVSILSVERPWLSEAEGFILPNHESGTILPAESQRNTIDSPVVVTDSSATEYDSVDESSVCSTPFPPLEKLAGVEPDTGSKTIKKSNFTFKAKALKGIIINEPSSAPAKGNKSAPASKVNSSHADKLKNVKIEDDPPLAIVIKKT
ncbi:retrovirus-related pol polyprotein from transposon TNT 1-94 [Tanacetum coccineum]